MLIKVEQVLWTLFKASAAQVATKYSLALTRTACRILVLFNLNTNPSLGFHTTTRLNVNEILIWSQAPHLTSSKYVRIPKYILSIPHDRVLEHHEKLYDKKIQRGIIS